MENLKLDINQNVQELESRGKQNLQQLQESQREVDEKFQRMINENKDNLETVKLKYLNERKEVEIELRDSFPEKESTENVFMDMLNFFKNQFSKAKENIESYQTENCQDKAQLRQELKDATENCKEQLGSFTKANLDNMAEKEEHMR